MKSLFLSKKTYFVTIIAVFLLGNVVSFAANPLLKEITAYLDSSIQMTIHGKQFVAKDADGDPVTPINYNGTTYLPTRAISEAVGLNVEWDETTRTVKLGNFITDENGKKKISFKSPDGSYQLTFNDDSVKDNSLKSSNPHIDLAVLSSNDSYTAVIVEDVEDYSSDLDNYLDLIISNMEDRTDSSNVESIIDLEVDGDSAKQAKIHSQISGVYISYLITIIETEEKFYQVLSWTTQNKFDESYEEFIEIAQSFKEQP